MENPITAVFDQVSLANARSQAEARASRFAGIIPVGGVFSVRGPFSRSAFRTGGGSPYRRPVRTSAVKWWGYRTAETPHSPFAFKAAAPQLLAVFWLPLWERMLFQLGRRSFRLIS